MDIDPTENIDALDASGDFGDDADFGDAPDKAGQPVETGETTGEAEQPTETDAAAPADDSDAGSAPPAQPDMLPRYRYNYAAKKRQEAEQRVAELEARLAELDKAKEAEAAAPPASDAPSPAQIYGRIDELDQELEEARLDGDRDKVLALRREQRNLELYVAQQNASNLAPAHTPTDPNVVTKEVLESMQVDKLVTEFESTYDALNPAHRDYNPEATEEAMELFDVFVRTMPRTQALQRAVNYVVASSGLTPNTGGAAKPKTDVQRKLDAAAAQPPDMGGHGFDSDKAGAQRKFDVMAMSVEEFEKLSEKDLDSLLV